MAIFNSKQVSKNQTHRGIYSGQEYDVEAVIRLKAGTVLATGDQLLALPVGENQVVTKVRAYAVGATGAAAVSLGYFQRKNADGSTYQVERYGPLADGKGVFVSPATDADAFAAGAVLSTNRQVVVPAAKKLAGPVYFGAEVTAGATLAADVEVHLGLTLVGELSDMEVNALYPDVAADQGLVD